MEYSVGELVEKVKVRILCELLNTHVGYPDCVGGWMMFYCTRCDSYAHPISPAENKRIVRQMLREEGCGSEDKWR